MSRPIQAGEAGRDLYFTNLNIDWDAAGYTLKLELTHKDTGATGEYDLEAVPDMPEQAKVATTALMFPLHGTYRAQVVAYSGATPMLRSTVESIVVLNNE